MKERMSRDGLLHMIFHQAPLSQIQTGVLRTEKGTEASKVQARKLYHNARELPQMLNIVYLHKRLTVKLCFSVELNPSFSPIAHEKVLFFASVQSRGAARIFLRGGLKLWKQKP